MAVTDEALLAVAKNAARHLIEANQHYNAKRFASAVASAVYAVEETGKMAQLLTVGKSPKNKRHASHSILFWALARFITDRDWLWEWAGILRGGLAPDVVLTEQQQRTMTAHPEYAAIVQQLRAGKLATIEERTQAFTSAMVAKEARDGTTNKWKPSFEQGLQPLRLRAIYVDLTESGFTSPEAIDSDQAHVLCWLGNALLVLILLMAVLVGPLKDHKIEVAQLLPDDLIGSAEIARFVQALASVPVTPPAAASTT